MNRIDFPRRDIYNVLYKKDDLEDWYVLRISNEIERRLNNNVHPTTADAAALLKRIIRVLPCILVMSPLRMKWYSQAVWKKYHSELIKKSGRQWVSTSFGRELLNAFNYDGYRQSKLTELAAWLNVKTCPYCNMSYTLYSEKVKPKRKKVFYTDRIARFQFDHFLSKRSFPMLSMSLYNLIPCCPVCNQGKSAHELPWLFHPYISDIQSLFAFEVKRPLPGFVGARFADYVSVKLNWRSSVCQKDSDTFEDAFHLSVLYARQGDVVQEVYDKAYLRPYFMELGNFPFFGLPGKEYLKRLWFDDYMTVGEIHKRPLSKFKQDVLAQALKEKQMP